MELSKNEIILIFFSFSWVWNDLTIDSKIKFKNATLKLLLYGYKDRYLIVKGRITLVGNERHRAASEQVAVILAGREAIHVIIWYTSFTYLFLDLWYKQNKECACNLSK